MLSAAPPRRSPAARSAEPDETRYRGYQVELESFSGPLDLLLSLIRREQVDIFDIPIARITDQYLAALADLAQNRVLLSGEFMVMAATLMQIKARLLLPKPPAEPDGEEPEDPRSELVRLLLDYEAYRAAARLLDELAQERDRIALAPGESLDGERVELRPIGVSALVLAFERVLARSQPPARPKVREAVYTVAEQSTRLLARLASGPVSFGALFGSRPDRLEVVVTFMALLDLINGGQVRACQPELFGELTLERVRSVHRD